MIQHPNRHVLRAVTSHFRNGAGVEGFDAISDQEGWLKHVATDATQAMRAHAREYLERRDDDPNVHVTTRNSGDRALRLAVPIYLEERYPHRSTVRQGLPENLRLPPLEGGMPSRRLLALKLELALDQHAHNERPILVLAAPDLTGSRPGRSAIGRRETQALTADQIEEACARELASVELLETLPTGAWRQMSDLVAFSSGRDATNRLTWSTVAHVLQEERARGGLAAYLVQKSPEWLERVIGTSASAQARRNASHELERSHLHADFREYVRGVIDARRELRGVRMLQDGFKREIADTKISAGGIGFLDLEHNPAAKQVKALEEAVQRTEDDVDRMRTVVVASFAHDKMLAHVSGGMNVLREHTVPQETDVHAGGPSKAASPESGTAMAR